MGAYQWDASGTPTQTTATVVTTGPIAAGDVLVAIEVGNFAALGDHGTALSGLGTTFTRFAAAQTLVAEVWIGQAPGALAAGQTLTMTGPALGATSRRVLILYSFRGITTTAAVATAVGASATATSADLAIGPGQVALAVGYSDVAADALISRRPTPMWATNKSVAIYTTTRYTGHSYREPFNVTENHAASATRASGNCYIHMIRLGDIVTPTMPAGAYVVENQYGFVACCAGTPFTFTTQNAIGPTDVVVLSYDRGKSGSYAKSGTLASGWTTLYDGFYSGLNNMRNVIEYQTGLTMAAGQTLTVTTTGLTAFGAHMSLLILRGLNVPSSFPVVLPLGWDGASTAATFYAPDGTLDVGQIANTIGYRSSITAPFPAATSLPATDWVYDYLSSGDGAVSHIVGTGRSLLRPGLVGASSQVGIASVTFGRPLAPFPSTYYRAVTPGSFTTGSFQIYPSLFASDLVVVIYSRAHSAEGSVSIDGGTLGLLGEWVTAIYRERVYTITGLTGYHTISYETQGSTSNVIAVYVIRDLTNPGITAYRASSWDQVESPSGTLESTPTAPIGPRQVAIGLAIVAQTNSTITWPASPTPSTGWIVDRAGSASVLEMLAHRNFADDVPSAQLGVQFTHATAGAMEAVLMLVAGDPEVVVPPPVGDMGGTWGG
jgi:hypothetical protein